MGCYLEYRPYSNDTIDESTRIVLPYGFGACSQLTVHVSVGGVAGGSDAIDFDLDTSFVKASDGSETWVEVLSMTQATAATTETKVEVRDGTATWSDRLSLEVTVAAGATASDVSVVIIGAMAATTA